MNNNYSELFSSVSSFLLIKNGIHYRMFETNETGLFLSERDYFCLDAEIFYDQNLIVTEIENHITYINYNSGFSPPLNFVVTKDLIVLLLSFNISSLNYDFTKNNITDDVLPLLAKLDYSKANMFFLRKNPITPEAFYESFKDVKFKENAIVNILDLIPQNGTSAEELYERTEKIVNKMGLTTHFKAYK